MSSWNTIDKPRLVNFLKSGLDALPSFIQCEENNRLTLIYFIISSLDMVDSLHVIKDKGSVIDYIYNLQLNPNKVEPEKNADRVGFRGSPWIGVPFLRDFQNDDREFFLYDYGHIAMTYVALALLRILGDDYSRVNRKAITSALRHLQQKDGSFSPVLLPSEHDMRFVFCACAISYMLDDWSGVDIDRVVEYVKASQSYEGSIGQGPGNEGHGGSTYCALASLKLCGRLDDLPRRSELIRWLSSRQVSGFQGRPNKDPDTCYSFWVGASLDLLGCHSEVVNPLLNRSFSLSCQSKIGGFSKTPGVNPDVLHTYYSLCGLSLQGEEGIQQLYTPLAISKRAAEVFEARNPKSA